MYHFIWALLALCATIAQANVEKTIFLAPTGTTVPSGEPDIDDLGLERLSPESPVVRTRLNATFPSNDAPEGTDSWFFLENLIPGQRYEVRICWLATVCLVTSIDDSKTTSDKNAATYGLYSYNTRAGQHDRGSIPPLQSKHILHRASGIARCTSGSQYYLTARKWEQQKERV